ncbi:hypothetical protein DNTS_029635, partial [Danionella cerebrum]
RGTHTKPSTHPDLQQPQQQHDDDDDDDEDDVDVSLCSGDGFLLVVAPVTAVAVGMRQQGCARGSCYPSPGDLLPGREHALRASSTCGLSGTEVVCVAPHGQWKMTCCPCDSRNPAAYNSHTIRNVISTEGPDRWWQSKKEVNPVTLQWDLNGLYHLEALVLSFKGPRPDALVIERSRDFGHTWRPVLYMATDCTSTFPQISTRFPLSLDETYCYTLPINAGDPYRDQKVYFYPLRQFTNIDLPKEHKIEVASGFTGLRINLIKFGSVPRMQSGSLSQFYALREIRVMGSCFCHGHAAQCRQETTTSQLPSTQVSILYFCSSGSRALVNTQEEEVVGGVCECQHNTAGVNCERCDDFHDDLPWRPAESTDSHACKRCQCNNHSERCRFHPERYEATGRTSGGVCEECLHHTTGANCERCQTRFYANPQSDMRSPDACLQRLQEHSLSLQRLISLTASVPPSGSGDEAELRIRALTDTLALIQESLRSETAEEAERDAQRRLDRLGQMFRRAELGSVRDRFLLMSPLDDGGSVERELTDLLHLLSDLSLDYRSKRETFANASRSHSSARGLFSLQTAFQESTDGLKRANAAKKYVKKSERLRGNALRNLNKIQPRNTKDLKKLMEDLATRPNLTPIGSEVCGSAHVDSCTPLRCEGDLCPADGAPPCGSEDNCSGAFASSSRAAQEAEEVKRKLQELSDKISQAAAQIQEAEDSTNRLQRVCDKVLEARLPLSETILKQKLREILDAMEMIPDSSAPLESSGRDLEEARRLLEAAKHTHVLLHSDAAVGLQQEGDHASKSMNANEEILKQLEEKIERSVSISKNVQENIQQIREALVPAERSLLGVPGVLEEIRPLLDTLRKDVMTGRTVANRAKDQASSARDEADGAAQRVGGAGRWEQGVVGVWGEQFDKPRVLQELAALKLALLEMKRAAAESSQNSEDAVTLKKLQEEAETLMIDTSDIMAALKDKESSLQRGAAEVEQSGARLANLEDHVTQLRDDIRYKATRLNMCQG